MSAFVYCMENSRSVVTSSNCIIEALSAVFNIDLTRYQIVNHNIYTAWK